VYFFGTFYLKGASNSKADEMTYAAHESASVTPHRNAGTLERNEVLIREFYGQDDHLLGVCICMLGIALAGI
jgi:hypothetical protein